MAKPPSKPPADPKAPKAKVTRKPRAKAPQAPAAGKGAHLRVVGATATKRVGEAYTATDQGKAAVTMGMLCGMTQEQIAAVMGIAPKTLRLHYRHELDTGKNGLIMKVAGNMAAIAINPQHPKCLTAGIFILKCQGGWREQTVEQEEADDSPVEFTLSIGEKSAG
jgi:hypothetical protein